MKKLGSWNIFGIFIIAVFLFFVSIFSLASRAQAQQWKLHWLSFLFNRLYILMSLALGLTAILIAFNIMSGLLISRIINWNKMRSLAIWSLSISLIVSVIGTCILLF